MQTLMTSYFPDLNVWLALSVNSHAHSGNAWKWLQSQPAKIRLLFSRYTQIGLLRLLTTPSVMGEQTLTLKKAWAVYDRWLEDGRVQFYPEPRGIDPTFRELTLPFGQQPAAKAIGDCYLLAYADELGATLLTYDAALHTLARKQGRRAICPE